MIIDHIVSRTCGPAQFERANELTRRGFLQGMGALSLLPPLRTVPELVLYRANILTIDPLRPRASAVAMPH